MKEVKPTLTKRDIATHLSPIKLILTNEKRIEKLAGFIEDTISQDTEGSGTRQWWSWPTGYPAQG